MTPASASKSRSKTASEAELEQRKAGPDGQSEKVLKESARGERKQQAEQLAAGKKTPGDAGLSRRGNPAQQRARDPHARPVLGVVDNMTARDGADPLVGHFVRIDYSKASVRDAVKSQLAPQGSPLADQGFEPGVGSADYGALVSVGEVGDDGYPVTGIVFLRDEHAAQIVVPWDALSRDTAGGRR